MGVWKKVFSFLALFCFSAFSLSGLQPMRMRKKSDLPQKICLHCGRPFAWRKKWEKVWDEVRYCSDRCRSERRKGAGGQGSEGGAA